MGRTRIRLLLAAVLLIPILLYWGAGGTPSERVSPYAPDAGVDSFMKGATLIQYDHQGNRARKIEAQSVQHNLGNSTYQAPRMLRHNQNGSRIEVTARNGQLDDAQQQLQLSGDVKLYKTTTAGKVQQIRTEQMDYFPATEIAETSAPVTLLAPGHEVTAVGLRADLKNGQIDLLSEVKGLHQNEQ